MGIFAQPSAFADEYYYCSTTTQRCHTTQNRANKPLTSGPVLSDAGALHASHGEPHAHMAPVERKTTCLRPHLPTAPALTKLNCLADDVACAWVLHKSPPVRPSERGERASCGGARVSTYLSRGARRSLPSAFVCMYVRSFVGHPHHGALGSCHARAASVLVVRSTTHAAYSSGQWTPSLQDEQPRSPRAARGTGSAAGLSEPLRRRRTCRSACSRRPITSSTFTVFEMTADDVGMLRAAEAEACMIRRTTAAHEPTDF